MPHPHSPAASLGSKVPPTPLTSQRCIQDYTRPLPNSALPRKRKIVIDDDDDAPLVAAPVVQAPRALASQVPTSTALSHRATATPASSAQPVVPSHDQLITIDDDDDDDHGADLLGGTARVGDSDVSDENVGVYMLPKSHAALPPAPVLSQIAKKKSRSRITKTSQLRSRREQQHPNDSDLDEKHQFEGEASEDDDFIDDGSEESAYANDGEVSNACAALRNRGSWKDTQISCPLCSDLRVVLSHLLGLK
jgi:hypothetical protein